MKTLAITLVLATFSIGGGLTYRTTHAAQAAQACGALKAACADAQTVDTAMACSMFTGQTKYDDSDYRASNGCQEALDTIARANQVGYKQVSAEYAGLAR